jgi:diacylglycerol kinase (ATP)
LLKDWLKSADHAIEGILYGTKSQRHLQYHFLTAGLVIFASYILGLSKSEFIVVSLSVIIVIFAEMINSSIETIIDLLSPEYSEKARIAKDMAAGAVFITAFGAAIIGYIVFMPYIKSVIQTGLNIPKHAYEDIILISMILILIIVIIIKSYFGKGHPLSGGMPSGHAAIAFSIWVAVTYSTRNFIASLLCFILAVLIAQSRVLVKVHNQLEVIIGALLGSALTLLLFRLFT